MKPTAKVITIPMLSVKIVTTSLVIEVMTVPTCVDDIPVDVPIRELFTLGLIKEVNSFFVKYL